MKKPLKLNSIVKLDIYNRDIMFSLGETDDEFAISIADFQHNKGDLKKARIRNNVLGRCFISSCNAIVVRLPVFPETCEHFGTLQHEIFHAICFVMGRAGIPLSESSEEAFAYLFGYVTEKIYDEINALL